MKKNTGVLDYLESVYDSVTSKKKKAPQFINSTIEGILSEINNSQKDSIYQVKEDIQGALGGLGIGILFLIVYLGAEYLLKGIVAGGDADSIQITGIVFTILEIIPLAIFGISLIGLIHSKYLSYNLNKATKKIIKSNGKVDSLIKSFTIQRKAYEQNMFDFFTGKKTTCDWFDISPKHKEEMVKNLSSIEEFKDYISLTNYFELKNTFFYLNQIQELWELSKKDNEIAKHSIELFKRYFMMKDDLIEFQSLILEVKQTILKGTKYENIKSEFYDITEFLSITIDTMHKNALLEEELKEIKRKQKIMQDKRDEILEKQMNIQEDKMEIFNLHNQIFQKIQQNQLENYKRNVNSLSSSSM